MIPPVCLQTYSYIRTCRLCFAKKKGTYSVHVRLTVLELASLEKKKEEERKMTIFDFFKIRFLSFYKPELKSEDICTQEGKGFQKISILLALGLVFMPFHPYLYVLSKHFNRPHPYIEIAVSF